MGYNTQKQQNSHDRHTVTCKATMCIVQVCVFSHDVSHSALVTLQNILGFGSLPSGTTSYLDFFNTRINDQLCPDTPYQLFSYDIKMHNVYLELSRAFLR